MDTRNGILFHFVSSIVVIANQVVHSFCNSGKSSIEQINHTIDQFPHFLHNAFKTIINAIFHVNSKWLPFFLREPSRHVIGKPVVDVSVPLCFKLSPFIQKRSFEVVALFLPLFNGKPGLYVGIPPRIGLSFPLRHKFIPLGNETHFHSIRCGLPLFGSKPRRNI